MTRDADIARIAVEVSRHNMLHDGRCDCGDHEDWPIKVYWNDHIAAALYDAGLRPSVEPGGMDGPQIDVDWLARVIAFVDWPESTTPFGYGDPSWVREFAARIAAAYDPEPVDVDP